MDYNFSTYSTLLTLESLDILPSNIFVGFIFSIFTYCVILLLNVSVSLTIALNRKLHKPMYVLLCNMQINDVVGATAFFPQLVSTILSQNRTITYAACFVQALLSHFYGAASFLILTAMAYDRYIAICFPLKYNTLMSPNNLLKIIIIIWILDFALVGLLLVLVYRKEICSTRIVDLFCNNPSLMKLQCDDSKVNNYYGLFLIILIQGVSLPTVILTYIQILIAVVSKRQSDAKSKAIQTCSTHLIVFLSLEFIVLFALLSHRFETVSPNVRRASGVSVMIFPPIINPLIYGLKTKEIRQNIFSLFKKVSPVKQKNLNHLFC